MYFEFRKCGINITICAYQIPEFLKTLVDVSLGAAARNM
jgi:hypothetical protein